MEDNNKETIDLKVKVDREEVDDTLDELQEHYNELNVPNITIRNNQAVYVTINNFNSTHEEYVNEQIKEEK